jgi:DNA-directed RNA polymerase I subunit RPA1
MLDCVNFNKLPWYFCIVSTHNQYLVPKDGTPLSGLIQDHIISGVLMTSMDQTFDKSMYQQLLYSALPDYRAVLKMLAPAYIRPKHLWSGKQILSTVLLNVIPHEQYKINLQSKAKISFKEWTKGLPGDSIKVPHDCQDPFMVEDCVIFRNGEFLCGVLDKSQFGPSEFGLVHACHELYGGIVASQLLSSLGRLFTAFLQLSHGFTLGIEDILVTCEADVRRQKSVALSSLLGVEAAAEVCFKPLFVLFLFKMEKVMCFDGLGTVFGSIHLKPGFPNHLSIWYTVILKLTYTIFKVCQWPLLELFMFFFCFKICEWISLGWVFVENLQ